MKLTQRLCSLLTALTIVCTSVLLPSNAFAAGIAGETDSEISLTAVNSLLTASASVSKVSSAELDVIESGLTSCSAASTKDAFYKEVQKNLLKHDTAFQVVYNGKYSDVDDLDVLFAKIQSIDDKKTSDDADYLAGSILQLSYSASYTSSKAIFSYAITYVETASQLKKVNTSVASALKKMNISKYSDLGKVKMIHDYVINLMDYDQTLIDHSSYGGLVASKHTTVCQGYALLMYKMLTEAGVPCHYVTGDAGEPHAWNIVKIDKKWYALDATWDDPIYTTPILRYDYFLVGSKTINKDHKLDSQYAKAYSVSTSDYNWQKKLADSSASGDKKLDTTQTKEEKLAAKNTAKRYAYAKKVSQELKKELDYSKENKLTQQIYDLYINVYVSVVKQMSDKAFKKLEAGNAKIVDYIDTQVSKLVEKSILNPAFTYLDSDKYADDTLKLIYADFSDKELDKMDDNTFDTMLEAYAFKALSNKLDKLSDVNTKKIVKQIVTGVNKLK